MHNARINILVVAPYTKRFGVAVFSNSELLYFAVNTFRLPRTIESIEAETIIRLKNLIAEFAPKLVIAKTLTDYQAASENHRRVAKCIRHVANMTHVHFKEISFEGIKRKFVTEARPTNTQTYAVLRRIYPELARVIQFQNRYQAEYYSSMLSAIAIGIAHQNRHLKLNWISK